MATRSGKIVKPSNITNVYFNAWMRYSESGEWVKVVDNSPSPENNGIAYDTDKPLYVKVAVSSTGGSDHYSFQGLNSGGGGIGGHRNDDIWTDYINSTITRWEAKGFELYFAPGQTGGAWEIHFPLEKTIPLTLLPDGICHAIPKTFEPPVNDSTSNVESTIKIRPVEPNSLKPEQPSLTYSQNGSGDIIMDAVWNEAEKGFDVKFTYNRISDISLTFQAKTAMATEKYGAFGDLGKSLSVTPVSTDTVIAVLARGKTDLNAATILAGIKKIDGHWDATAILNCNAAQDHTGKPCSSEDAVVTMGFIKTGANILPLSAIRAGLCARSDAEYGAPARSGGNLPIPNAEAWGSYEGNSFTAMPISETLATRLSAEGVCAVVNYSGTYRTWGDHTSLFAAGTVSDERARFDNSIRMLRSITNRFQLKYRASIDSPFTLQMRNDIINEQLDYLNGLVAKGALIGKPTCEFRAIDNPKDNIQKGEFKWNITCTTTNPLKYAYVSVSYTSAGLDSLVEEG